MLYIDAYITILEKSTFITSKNYPAQYVDFLTQKWIARATSGKVVLYFNDFELEYHHDAVELR